LVIVVYLQALGLKSNRVMATAIALAII